MSVNIDRELQLDILDCKEARLMMR